MDVIPPQVSLPWQTLKFNYLVPPAGRSVLAPSNLVVGCACEEMLRSGTHDPPDS